MSTLSRNVELAVNSDIVSPNDERVELLFSSDDSSNDESVIVLSIEPSSDSLVSEASSSLFSITIASDVYEGVYDVWKSSKLCNTLMTIYGQEKYPK